MAKIAVQYNCGCDFKTENILEAVLHCDMEQHSMEATGTICKDGTRLDLNKVEIRKEN